MDRRRYQPVVAVWGNYPNDHYAQLIRALDVPVIALGTKPTRLAKWQDLRSLVSDLRPEVIHSYTFYTNIAAWWVARGTGAVPIGSVRSSFTRASREAGQILGRLCGRWPSGQVFNSFSAEQEAKHSTKINRPRRIYVVMNGVDLDRYIPQPYPERGYILAVGSLSSVKRWDRLIRAVGFLASKGLCPEVLLAGSGLLREDLEVMARSLHVDHLVRFLGARNDIPDLLAGAAFLVHTAESEGCPNVIMEAMACGRAVIATDAGDIPYLVDEGKTGFVVPREDETALTGRMEILLGDCELSCRMGDAGRTKAEQAFGINRLMPETFAVYRAEGWKDK
jgi:glycosyltransferase involved in cell wall biosynthesis